MTHCAQISTKSVAGRFGRGQSMDQTIGKRQGNIIGNLKRPARAEAKVGAGNRLWTAPGQDRVILACYNGLKNTWSRGWLLEIKDLGKTANFGSKLSREFAQGAFCQDIQPANCNHPEIKRLKILRSTNGARAQVVRALSSVESPTLSDQYPEVQLHKQHIVVRSTISCWTGEIKATRLQQIHSVRPSEAKHWMHKHPIKTHQRETRLQGRIIQASSLAPPHQEPNMTVDSRLRFGHYRVYKQKMLQIGETDQCQFGTGAMTTGYETQNWPFYQVTGVD
ncbi:hypothetical protein PoB_002076100 [Plakobranchus ocellatus]|uniref:Uncharacterized protein n=1 Tax=Plakobranchus ocellatus TaxID=259542 RepID=A0AAV3ZHZ5_9GAST|nr:hypothetical protein PoB_002076100 [Plakobranchus ocellatus]